MQPRLRPSYWRKRSRPSSSLPSMEPPKRPRSSLRMCMPRSAKSSRTFPTTTNSRSNRHQPAGIHQSLCPLRQTRKHSRRCNSRRRLPHWRRNNDPARRANPARLRNRARRSHRSRCDALRKHDCRRPRDHSTARGNRARTASATRTPLGGMFCPPNWATFASVTMWKSAQAPPSTAAPMARPRSAKAPRLITWSKSPTTAASGSTT